MKNVLCEKLGMDYPIFAFTHCRDVVVAVSKAGGFGVLGAVGFSPEQLREELDWIDEHIGDHGYGVDIVIPEKYEGMGDMSAEELEAQLWKMIPQEHIDFAQKLLADAGVPEWPDGTKSMGLMGWTEATATPLLEEALTRPRCRMNANALGTPPADKIRQVQESGRLIGALCGKVKQAVAHKAAGLDRRHRRYAIPGCGRHWQWPPDRRGHGDGRQRCMDRIPVADRRGSTYPTRSEGIPAACEQR